MSNDSFDEFPKGAARLSREEAVAKAALDAALRAARIAEGAREAALKTARDAEAALKAVRAAEAAQAVEAARMAEAVRLAAGVPEDEGWLLVQKKKRGFLSTPTRPIRQVFSAPPTPVTYASIAAQPPRPIIRLPIPTPTLAPIRAPIHLGQPITPPRPAPFSFDVGSASDFPTPTPLASSTPQHPARRSTTPESSPVVRSKGAVPKRLFVSEDSDTEVAPKRPALEKKEKEATLRNWVSSDNSSDSSSDLNQYGEGRKRKAPKRKAPTRQSTPPPAETPLNRSTPLSPTAAATPTVDTQPGAGVYINGDGSVSKEELEYFSKYTSQTQTAHFKRRSPLYLMLEPLGVKLLNTEEFPDNAALHQHLSKIFDIFIRKSILDVGGDLSTTKYWFGVDNPNHPTAKDQWAVTYKTHSMCGGAEIMNSLAIRLQSNSTIRLDSTLGFYMNIFKDSLPKDLVGKGLSDSEESQDDEEETQEDEEEEEEAVKLPKKGLRRQRLRKYHLSRYFGESLVVGPTHCLPKALALGKLKADLSKTTLDAGEKKSLERKLRRATRRDRKNAVTVQLEMAKELLDLAGMDTSVESHTMDDLKMLAAVLPDYQIKLWVCEEKETVPHLDEHLNDSGQAFIGLVHYANHFDCVNSLKKEASEMSFCYKCLKWGKNDHHKKCGAKCWCCGWTTCEGTGNEKIHCADCNLHFKSQECFDGHLKPPTGQSLPNCKKYFYCSKCLHYDRTLRYSGVPHACGARNFCKICKGKRKPGHECAHHIPTKDEKEKMKEGQTEWVGVTYDMECIVAESGEFKGQSSRGPAHKPNMIAAKIICNVCRGKDCKTCGEAIVFSYHDGVLPDKTKNPTLERFIKFLLEDPRLHRDGVKGVKVFAHNGGRYDHLLCLKGIEEYLGHDAPNPNLITNGWTVISARINHKKRTLHFLDTLQFLQMGLAKMPGAFGLTGEAKGFFPYLYNHPDNYDKVLPTLPPKEYYSPEFMSSEQRAEFEKWYEENFHQVFKLYEEMKKYVLSDVRILTQALVCFIDICETIFDKWNPILNATTLASYSMFVLRHIYIKEGDVGVIPENGFGGGNNSHLALKYLLWLEKTNPGLKLQFKLRGGEKLIRTKGGNYFADGYDEKTKTVYEVNGCIFHGCPTCHPDPDQFSPLQKETKMSFLRDQTARREKEITDVGYTVKSIWECDIEKELKKNKEMDQFFKLCKHTHNLKPRDALYGGRTQAFRSKAEATLETELNYLDFTSLYPFLNAGGTAYPRGNPKRMEDDFPKVDEPLKLRGLVYCDVLPAPDTPIGFLPQKMNQKLMFVLCRTCGNDLNISSPCTHTKVSERFLTGVWCSDELNYAVERGYKVLKYHEIWHWDDKDWVTGGFFADYIKPLLKLKHESSGWPRSDMTEEEKDAFIEKISKNDGVELDRENIKVNKAMRSLAKLFLNSAWGKFVQNPMKVETKLYFESDGVGVKKYLDDPKYEPVDMKPFGERKVFISRRPVKECLSTSQFTNIAIGAQTTCAGRLRLLEGMEMAGYENLLYCDTDSIIFKSDRGTDPLAALKGEQLGFMTSEIPEGLELIGVVVMAPKVYGLKMVDKDGTLSFVVKAKGVRPTSGNAEKVTFQSLEAAMDNFISSGQADPIMTELMTFKRGDNLLDGLWTCVFKKKLNPTMDKGHYDAEGVVTPFGLLPTGTPLIDDYPFR